jgi:hypothetical protein
LIAATTEKRKPWAVTTGERISAWQPPAYNIVGALKQAAHYAGELAT